MFHSPILTSAYYKNFDFSSVAYGLLPKNFKHFSLMAFRGKGILLAVGGPSQLLKSVCHVTGIFSRRCICNVLSHALGKTPEVLHDFEDEAQWH
jgi:hypothetical protein